MADAPRKQSHTTDNPPGSLEVQEKEASILSAGRQSHSVMTPIEPILSHTPPTHAPPLQPHDTPKIAQSTDEPSVMWIGPAHPHGCTQQKSLGSPAIGPVRGPRATAEAAALAPVTHGLCQDPAPVKGCDSNECRSENGSSGEDDASGNQGDTQDPFSDISWEGWGLINTPEGVYFPETFNPSPSGSEALTDRW